MSICSGQIHQEILPCRPWKGARELGQPALSTVMSGLQRDRRDGWQPAGGMPDAKGLISAEM
jgi:hypothetical protein